MLRECFEGWIAMLIRFSSFVKEEYPSERGGGGL